jgi:hypothetical protein
VKNAFYEELKNKFNILSNAVDQDDPMEVNAALKAIEKMFDETRC